MSETRYEVIHFFDPETSTLTYVVTDPRTNDAVVIDPVLNYDQAASKVSYESIDLLLKLIRERKYHIKGILETHAHADHLSGSQRLKAAFPNAPLCIGEKITMVQETFRTIFRLPESFPVDGRQFDRLLKEGERVAFGSLQLVVFSTPGHTLACCSYLFGDALFTGDTLFMPDSGTGRCDFPRGDARTLYRSITSKIYSLPESTRVFVGHDYQPNGRALAFSTTVGEQKKGNIQLQSSTSEEEYVAFRTKRDQTLKAPKLLFPSLLANIDAGRLPRYPDGTAFLWAPVSEPKLDPSS